MEKIILNQFGSVVTFAIELENQLIKYYEMDELKSITNKYSNDLTHRITQGRKNITNLERTRRENVTEITLEPIEGLDASEFKLNLSNFTQQTINTNEAIMCKFYNLAGPKINVLETARIFKRIYRLHDSLKKLE